MQAVEGPDKTVTELFEKISTDPRHRGVIVLLKHETSRRSFPNWSMGFKNLREIDLTNLPGYQEFFDDSLTSHRFKDDPTLAQRLLLTFREKM